MFKYIALTALFVLFISGCSTLDVKADYDREYDFSKLSKFSVLYSKKGDAQDFTRGRIERVLVKYFEAKGYKNSSKDEADFYLLLHLNVVKKSQVETNYESIGLHPRAYMMLSGRTTPSINPQYAFLRRGFMDDTRVITSTYEYEEGKLIIELMEKQTQNILWQGVVEDDISDISSKEDIEKIITEMFKDFPHKR